jgi:hypothetical protein
MNISTYLHLCINTYRYMCIHIYIFVYKGGIVHLLASLSVNYDLYPHDTIRLYLPGFRTEDGGSQGERFNLGVTMSGINFTRSIWSPENAYIDIILGGGSGSVAISKNTMIRIDIQGSSGLFAPYEGLFCYICIIYNLYVDSLTYAFGWSAFLCRIRFCDTLVVIF